MTAIDKKFYNLFWTDPTCQKIFSSHKSQLLEDEVELIVTREKFFAQRLVLTNSQKRQKLPKLAKRAENESIELIHDLQTAVSKYLDENRIEAFLKKKFGKSIKKFEADLAKTGGWIKLAAKLFASLDNQEDFFKLLSAYHLIPKEIRNKKEFGNYVENEFIGHLRDFIKTQNLSELAISIDLVSIYYNHKLKNNLVSATKHYTDTLYDSENFNDRIEFFDNLYEIKVINGGKLRSYYECVNCPPNTFSGILTLDIKPSCLKMKCPCCKGELFYIVPYEIDKLIYSHIVHKDGLLFFAIESLLEQNNLKYKKNYNLPPDIEIDFCLFNDSNLIYEIIEVKMFKLDRPFDTQLTNLKEAISQIKKVSYKLSNFEENSEIIPKILVTNIADEMVLKAAKAELEKELKRYNISLLSPNDFYEKIKK